VCLNILREDWKPVLNLNAVVVGLQVCHGGVKSETDG
jgi:ubiquitin-protein ligase